MTPGRLHKRLKGIVGREHVLASTGARHQYSYDGSLDVAQPTIVALPSTGAQVADVVRLAAAEGIPYVARGAGTNLSGGSVAVRGGIVIGLARMNRILSIDEDAGYAVVEPGVVNQHLQDVLGRRGFFYAPDPASQKVATLGGNVGENSGGPHCLKYGVTTNHVLGLELVTPEGERVEVGDPTGMPAGFDLTGLLVGSEGTFGIATTITVRILRQPECTKTMLAIYDDLDDASQTVSDIIARGILPATLEMMDQPIMHAIEESLHAGYPLDAEAVLIIELDGMADGMDEMAAEVTNICREHHVRRVTTARTAQERDALWAGRRGAFGAIARIAPNFLVMDGTVPRTELARVLRASNQVTARYGFKSANVFHAGDGNLHPLLLFDAREPGAEERVRQAGHEILDLCVEAGGTITGEHGVGLEKLDDMDAVFTGDDMAVMRAIKQALDPRDLCNPGKVIPAHVGAATTPTARQPKTSVHKGRAVDGMSPTHVVRPESEAEIAEIVAWCRQESLALVPWAGGTRMDLGNLPARYDVALDLDGLPRHIEHDADNMTLLVSANVTLAEVQDELRRADQYLPMEAPAAGAATVGGLVATATCGPRSVSNGRPRDLLLGLRAVLGTGTITTPGGRTIKNVAGYDLTRLLAGSCGSLGIITELAFRLLPTPAQKKVLIFACDNAAMAGELAQRIMRTDLLPSGMVFTDVPAGCSLAVGVEGVAAAVTRMDRDLAALAGAAPAAVIEDRSSDSFWSAFVPGGDHGPRLRASLLRTRAVPLIQQVSAVFQEAGIACDTHCHAATGQVCFRPSALTTATLERLRALDGSLIVDQAPSEIKAAIDVWGGEPGAIGLMGRVKGVCDPDHVLSPGRNVGRL